MRFFTVDTLTTTLYFCRRSIGILNLISLQGVLKTRFPASTNHHFGTSPRIRTVGIQSRRRCTIENPLRLFNYRATSTSKAMASGTLARMRLILTKPPSLQIAQTQEFFNFSQPDRNSLKFGFREQITNWYDHIIPASTFQHQCAQMHTMSVHELDSVSFISKFM